MLDYRLLEAFAAVINEGGFERAGLRLGLTQSAVSQRVRNLEELAGTILIIRENPPRATPMGIRVLRHFVQVQALEAEAFATSGQETDPGFITLGIAVNIDSLATWFLKATRRFLSSNSVLFDIQVDDQDQTIKHLRSGTVMACVSSRKESITGCVSVKLGSMEYRLCASPAFRDQWFRAGFTADAAANAPIIHCNRADTLQTTALAQCFGSGAPKPPAHYIPSNEQIFQAVVDGLSYCMLPAIQASQALENGSLVELDRSGRVSIDLYWHRWTVSTTLIKKLEEELLDQASQLFSRR